MTKKIIIYYICKSCGGKTIFKENCVWCGSIDFIQRKREMDDIISKRVMKKNMGTHFGIMIDEFCLEI